MMPPDIADIYQSHIDTLYEQHEEDIEMPEKELCEYCNGNGCNICEYCLSMAQHERYHCPACTGSGVVKCEACQGTGYVLLVIEPDNDDADDIPF